MATAMTGGAALERHSPLALAGDAWQRAQRARRRPLAENTLASYVDAWGSFCSWAAQRGIRTLGEVGARDLAHWIDALHGMADASVQTYTHGAMAIMRFAADCGALGCDLTLLQMHARDALPRIPAARAPEVPDLRRLVTFYDHELPAGPVGSRQERERLSGLRNAALLHLLFSSGARISEVMALDVAGIRDDDGRISSQVSVLGKGGRRRMIFIRQHARYAIERYLLPRRAMLPHATALFVSHGPRGAGARLNRTSGWKIVTDAAYTVAEHLEAAGRPRDARLLRTTTPHTFRHFVATWLLNEGAQLSEVSAILGHASTRITEQYYARHHDARLQELHEQFAPDPLTGRAR
jgi:site-specific recombinase XerD